MAQNYSKEYNQGPSGGCKVADVHEEMRSDKYQNDIFDADVGTEKDDKLMMPPTENTEM